MVVETARSDLRQVLRDGWLNMVVPAFLLAEIEEWRRAQPKIPSISRAVRELLEVGLKTAKKGGRGR